MVRQVYEGLRVDRLIGVIINRAIHYPLTRNISINDAKKRE